MVARRSEAEWRGGLEDGAGALSLGSGTFRGDYSYASRFESASGTNPEELPGAAHAACLSMALSTVLGAAGFTPRSIKTPSDVHVAASRDGFSISRIDLVTEGDVPGIDLATFSAQAEVTSEDAPCRRRWRRWRSP